MASGLILANQAKLTSAASDAQNAVRKQEFDAAIAGLTPGGAGVGLVDVDDTTGAVSIAPQNGEFYIVTVGAGAGGYTETVTLDDTLLDQPTVFWVLVKMPASLNPEITLSYGSDSEIFYGQASELDYSLYLLYLNGTSTWSRLI